MIFSLDMHPDSWPLRDGFEFEFIVVNPMGRVYRVTEYHESRRTARRLICQVEPLGVIPVDGHGVIECVRHKRKKRR